MAEQKRQLVEDKNEVLIRIKGQDIAGDKNIYCGLTKIKGVSWSISGAICNNLKLKKREKIHSLNKENISKIEQEISNLNVPDFIKNRKSDFDSGESKHLFGTDLDMRKDFDIKRLKQIKSYKGLRHSLKLPVRGQRTRSHFRKSGIAVGVKKPKMGKKS